MGARYADRMPLYASALKKMPDVITMNGVPHNNWDIIQARFIFSIALALDCNSSYEDGKGRKYYLEVVARDSTLRQWGLKTLADYGFDDGTGIWSESPGYSCNVVDDYVDFVSLFDRYLGKDLTADIPVIEKAVPATPQYCFPNRKIVGFGDTHPGPLRTDYFLGMVQNARRHGKWAQEEKFTAMLRAFDPGFAGTRSGSKTDGNWMDLYFQEGVQLDSTIAGGRIETYVSPTFYDPNVSWLVQRNGMDVRRSLMYSLNVSEGNHQHANGLSVEFYGKGLTLGPDAGIGKSLYAGADYAEYYSQFPSHNTVCVDGISAYPVMDSHHAFKLLHAYPQPSTADRRNLDSDDYFRGVSYSESYFREPESQADQIRLLSIIDAAGGGYYVDVFRSRKAEGGDRMHDYFYHNLGQTLDVTAADGSPLNFTPTEELSFAGAHLYAYSYIYDQQTVRTDKDIRADFTVHPDSGRADIRMTMWQQGMPGRKIFRALSPETEGLSRDRTYPYSVSGTPTLTFEARQEGEAWTRPFVSVFEPSVSGEGNLIANVDFFTPESLGRDAVGIHVKLKNGQEDWILSSVDSVREVRHEAMSVRAVYSCLRREDGKPVRLFMGHGLLFKAEGVDIRTEREADVSLQRRDTEWYYTTSAPCTIRFDGCKRKVEATDRPLKW
ncbi:MAG: heparinase II/III-family protein [Paraprevotella sp.]|nr:heparinase II/III-family protein [Paraprevotella sp.]